MPMTDLSPKQDWALGMLFGLAIGDAMGAPLEFQSPREPENYVKSFMSGGAHNVSKGEFTDDTSMALAMADALILKKRFDPKATMENFLKWKNDGAFSPRGLMFDCGNTIFAALSRYERDRSNPYQGTDHSMSAGNGGLMRLAPVIIAASNVEQAIDWAEASTRLTHAAEEALNYSRLLAEELWCRKPLEKFDGFRHKTNQPREGVMSGGYVKETYSAAWWAFQTTISFEECVIEAINLGHDSDTTGAVAGMIAGAIYGYSSIPQWMIDGLQWTETISSIGRELVKIPSLKT